MKTMCHDCGMAFPVNPEFANLRVDCPHCGASRILRANEIIRDRPRRQAVSKPDGFDWAGFTLGMLLNIPGIAIAAFLNGARGAVAGLWGFAINIIGVILGAIYLRLAQGF